MNGSGSVAYSPGGSRAGVRGEAAGSAAAGAAAGGAPAPPGLAAVTLVGFGCDPEATAA